MQGTDEKSNAITLIWFYLLNDENARKFYVEFWFKTLTIIKMKGWNRPFEFLGETIPVIAPSESALAEEKELYKSNQEGYNQLVMNCSGTPLVIVQRAKGNV